MFPVFEMLIASAVVELIEALALRLSGMVVQRDWDVADAAYWTLDESCYTDCLILTTKECQTVSPDAVNMGFSVCTV